MKNLKIKIVSLLVAVALCLGFGFSPMLASAETVTETPETSAEIPETSNDGATEEETPVEEEINGYYCKAAENKGVMFVLKDESNVDCIMYLDGIKVATVNATYKRVGSGDVIDVYAMGDWLGAFRLNADGTATDISYQYEDEETNDGNSSEETLPDVTLDDMLGDELTQEEKLEIVLGVAGALAESAGVGSEYERIMKDLKNAATEKQVTLMTIAVIVEIALLAFNIIGKLIYKRIKSKQEKEVTDNVKKIKETGEQLTTAYNSSAEATEHVAEEVEEANTKLVTIAAAQEGTNNALRCIIQGASIKATLKDHANRSLNNSDALLDTVKK